VAFFRCHEGAEVRIGSGIVHSNVDAAKFFCGLGHHCLHRLITAGVGGNGQGLSPFFLDNIGYLIQPFLFAAG